MSYAYGTMTEPCMLINIWICTYIYVHTCMHACMHASYDEVTHIYDILVHMYIWYSSNNIIISLLPSYLLSLHVVSAVENEAQTSI